METSTSGSAIAPGVAAFWIAVVIYLVSLFALDLWTYGANTAYIRLYQSITGVSLLPRFEDYISEPWRWPAESIGFFLRAVKTMWGPQANAELKAAHRRVVFRTLLTLALMVFGLPALIVFTWVVK